MTKIGKILTITMNADFEIENARKKAETLVKRLDHSTGSKMLAYYNLAQAFEVSESWLRKFLKAATSTDDISLRNFINIAATFERMTRRQGFCNGNP